MDLQIVGFHALFLKHTQAGNAKFYLISMSNIVFHLLRYNLQVKNVLKR